MQLAEALPAFGLPALPQRVELLPAHSPKLEVDRVQVPAGRFLLLLSSSPLLLAYEATLYEILAEGRFPCPRPRRSLAGSLMASNVAGGATCYPIPPGEPLEEASQPQLLEIGRLLARLHALGETHPAKVEDPVPGLPALPSGAIHGGVRRANLLFIGDRCSAVLPSGRACFGPLVLDLVDAARGFMKDAPLATLRAVVSGYQSMRRLLPEEMAGLPQALRARTSLGLSDDEVLSVLYKST